MKSISRKNLTRLLIACVSSLMLLVCVISFSTDPQVPTWSQIFGLNSYPDEDFVCFIDVGQGDSILIHSNGKSAMIDFGNNTDNGSKLMYRLRNYGIRNLDCMLVTHYDADHIGGADSVLKQIDVKNIIIPKHYNESSKAYIEFETSMNKSNAKVYVAEVGTIINIGDFELTIVGHYENESDTNERSLIIMAEIDGVKFLFTGDASSDIEKQLINDKLNLDCDVFKAAHHGSKESNSISFLKHITPIYVAISCGELNIYGHPHDEAITNFNTVGAKVFRTDINGDITFYIENGIIVPKLQH